MKNPICLFEDEFYINFLPLVHTRTVYDLRCGILSLREKLEKFFGKVSYLHGRKLLEEVLKEKNPGCKINVFDADEILFINGRLLPDKKIIQQIKKLEKDSILKTESAVVAARVSKNHLRKIFSDNSEFPHFESSTLSIQNCEVNLLQYPWDLINRNGEEIKNDFNDLVKKTTRRKIKGVEQNNSNQIFISKEATIDPFVYLDASKGPIYIDKNVHIMSNTLIQGPAYIGGNSLIKAHSKIYHETSIGLSCKVGGEVESSIIHSFSNKQHEGFLGHAYLGSWVNLGADTNNSDLKNNYSNVQVLLNGKNHDTGSRFMGLIMGDHSKTAINTMFNTGTIVGVSCNIFGAGFPPRYIPSFSWGGSDFLRNYDIEKSLEVARIVYSRRNVTLSPAEELLLRNIYELTKPERIKKK